MLFSIKKIRLIVGLGNIGNEYRASRHNIGFTFLDKLAEFDFKNEPKFSAEMLAIKLDSHKLLLCKPTTLMNNSGYSVQKIAHYFNIDTPEILVVHDDLDIQLGEYKIHFGKGPNGHNGLISIQNLLKTQDFWRLRIGIENRTLLQKKNSEGANYVLSKFTQKETNITNQVIKNSIEKIISQ